MVTATVTLVIADTEAGVVGVDYALVALLPEFQIPAVTAWLAAHEYTSGNPAVSAYVLTGDDDLSKVPEDAPRLDVPATDALLQQLGNGSGLRGSLTAHPYDDGTYATALADLHRLGDNLNRRDEIIRAASAGANIDRTEITTITGLPAVTVDRALAPLDPEAFRVAREADLPKD